ncbi:MAG: PA2169 family four-helix-bundle protein [Flavobacteriales bacterium]|nr:PA2169 family four-helix-bundle protein [Flavobacteriales bacterium]
MDAQKASSDLIDLYQLLGDSIKGYNEAAEKVKTPELAFFLANIATERRTLRHELGEEARRLRPDADLTDGTLKGDVHRAWIGIREALSSSSDNSVLQECARGEDYLADRFKSVMEDEDTPAEYVPMLREQGTKVAMTKANIIELGKSIKYNKDQVHSS